MQFGKLSKISEAMPHSGVFIGRILYLCVLFYQNQRNDNMKTRLYIILLAAASLAAPQAQAFDTSRALGGLLGLFQAASVTDAQMADYVRESVEYMDRTNTVLPAGNPYTERLSRLTEGITYADGIPLNFKVYQTEELNAFACPDGSVRVFTGIMDRMDDEQLLGIIGHEIGHVVKRHSKKAFKEQLLSGALKEVIASTGGVAAALTDSQLYTLAQGLGNARYSQKQENEADDCGYDFLVANGRNPYGMVRAFRVLDEIEQASGAQPGIVQKMFSSHPDTKKRIEHMEKRCRKDGYGPSSVSPKQNGNQATDQSSRRRDIPHAPKTNLEIHF